MTLCVFGLLLQFVLSLIIFVLVFVCVTLRTRHKSGVSCLKEEIDEREDRHERLKEMDGEEEAEGRS